MGAMVIMGSVLVEELNGDVPEESYPKTLEEVKEILVPDDEGFGYWLPKDWPHIVDEPGRYGLINTHPAPTIATVNTYGEGASRRIVDLLLRESGQTLHV